MPTLLLISTSEQQVLICMLSVSIMSIPWPSCPICDRVDSIETVSRVGGDESKLLTMQVVDHIVEAFQSQWSFLLCRH